MSILGCICCCCKKCCCFCDTSMCINCFKCSKHCTCNKEESHDNKTNKLKPCKCGGKATGRLAIICPRRFMVECEDCHNLVFSPTKEGSIEDWNNEKYFEKEPK